MYFKIEFSTIKPGKVLEVEATKSFGIELLDELREKIKADVGETCIDAVVVENTIPALHEHTYSIEISEEIARGSDLFKQTDRVKIKCSKGFLNRFVKRVPRFISTMPEIENYDKIGEAGFVNKVDNEALLEAWKMEGYPVKWVKPSIFSKVLFRVGSLVKNWQPSWLDTEQIS